MSTRVIDAITCLTVSKAGIVPLVAYDATTDQVIDVQGMKEKAVMVKAAGNTVTYQILGSIDGGVEYDVVVKADTAVLAAAQDIYRDSVYYTHWKVRVKAAAAATATVKAAAIGV